MQNSYISLTQARERILTTLFVLDQDMKEWQAMRDAIREDETMRPNRRQKKGAIEQEFENFFNSSAQIRQKLTDYLSLFETVHEN
jgi:TorA maturation chaperone TorD